MKKKMSFVMAGMMAVSSMSLGSVATFAEEPYTVKIVCVGDATTEACEEVSKAVSEITMEKYGVNVELVRLSYGSFQQEVNLMLASGEKLDLFPNFSFTTMSASATGQIIPLDDLLAEYGQDILDVVPEEDWGVETFGGQIYAVPNGKEHAEGFGFVCRTDMLEALDYDIDSIKTDDDVEGLLAAVKEKYPDVYPLVSDNGQMSYYMGHKDDLGGDFGVLVDCIEENYTIENWYESDEFYKLAERRYNWAQAGYIMPDAETNTQNAYDLIGAGKAFGYYGNTKPGIENEWARKAGVEMTMIEITSPYRTSSTGMNCWFIAHNSEQPDKAMMVLGEDSREFAVYKRKIGTPRVIGLYAKRALTAKKIEDQGLLEESNFPEFERALETMLTKDRGTITLQILANKITNSGTEILRSVVMQENALMMANDEFMERYEAAIGEIDDIRN